VRPSVRLHHHEHRVEKLHLPNHILAEGKFAKAQHLHTHPLLELIDAPLSEGVPDVQHEAHVACGAVRLRNHQLQHLLRV
jgi:hypothetical protein